MNRRTFFSTTAALAATAALPAASTFPAAKPIFLGVTGIDVGKGLTMCSCEWQGLVPVSFVIKAPTMAGIKAVLKAVSKPATATDIYRMLQL